MASMPQFEGLVQDVHGLPVPVKRVGAQWFYVVSEDGFDWHIEGAKIDDAVWRRMKDEFQKLKGNILPQVLAQLGQDDPFTAAAYEMAIDNMGSDNAMSIPQEHKDMLALMGFRIVVDYHGAVLEVAMPTMEGDPDDLDDRDDDR